MDQIENNIGEPFVNDPFLALGSVGEDILVGNALLDDDLACFDLPEGINAGDDGKGEKEAKEEKDCEQYVSHRLENAGIG